MSIENYQLFFPPLFLISISISIYIHPVHPAVKRLKENWSLKNSPPPSGMASTHPHRYQTRSLSIKPPPFPPPFNPPQSPPPPLPLKPLTSPPSIQATHTVPYRTVPYVLVPYLIKPPLSFPLPLRSKIFTKERTGTASEQASFY